MVTLIPALPSETVFGLPHKGKLRPFSKSQIDRKFQGLIKSSGLESSRLSFHSLRWDCASLASLAGCSDSDICTVGDWKSGPSCSKLTTSLVNMTLKFQTYYT